jgi:two-component system phosphate regulon response regulator OmpR
MTQRLLIIDDDTGLTAMLTDYLRPFGIDLVAAHTAADGLGRLGREAFDALILDVMLPDIDGFSVARQIRATREPWAQIPIVMLTARGDETDRIVGLELGTDDYLPKPFNPRELLARLRAVLRRREPVAGGAPRKSLRFGRLEIDQDTRSVLVDGQPRGLTGYQFDLLWALACNSGRVMTREAIMDQLRGDALESFDRSIDVHISRIRAAIEDDPRLPRRIITIRGSGYLFARVQD